MNCCTCKLQLLFYRNSNEAAMVVESRGRKDVEVEVE